MTDRPNTSAARIARRLRILYTSLAVLVTGTAVVLLLSMKSSSPGLFALGFGSLAIAVTALIADAEEGTHALVRTGRLMRTERCVLVIGLVVTLAAVIAGFIEVAAGLSGRESAILAVVFASSTGLFGLTALVRD